MKLSISFNVALMAMMFSNALPSTSVADEQNVLAFENGAVLLDYSSAHKDDGYGSNWIALALIDGSTKTGWSSLKNSPFPHVFSFELSQDYLIHALELDNTDAYENSHPGVSAIQVVVTGAIASRDGPFQELYRGDIIAADNFRIDLETPAKIRWLQVQIDGNGGRTDHTELMEVRAFSKDFRSSREGGLLTSGTYETTWNNLYLAVDGHKVSGCYDFDNGTFTGALTGETLSIEWVEDGPQIGKAILAITEDGSNFNGFWYEDGQKQGIWKGVRASDDLEPNCTAALKREAKTQVEVSIERTGRAVLYGIYFDYDSATLLPKSEPVLASVEDWIKNNPGQSLRIEGHTDSDGSDAYNLDLSNRRAQSVVDWLVGRGAAPNQLSSVGIGEAQPVASNDSVDGKALNRRVEVHLE